MLTAQEKEFCRLIARKNPVEYNWGYSVAYLSKNRGEAHLTVMLKKLQCNDELKNAFAAGYKTACEEFGSQDRPTLS